jgi:hypothetical protein
MGWKWLRTWLVRRCMDVSSCGYIARYGAAVALSMRGFALRSFGGPTITTPVVPASVWIRDR